MTAVPTSGLRLLAVVVAMLAGCETELKITLFNGSAGPVTVRADGDEVAIGTGQSGRIAYPGDWKMSLSTPKCDYSYAMPQTLDGIQPYQVADGGLKVQIAGDFGIYLLPGDSQRIAAISEIASLQRGGFPLRPTGQSCH